MIVAMTKPQHLLAVIALCGALVLGACSSSDSDKTSQPDPTEATGQSGSGNADVEEALEAQTPTGTVEVPSADGALTIADWAAGGSEVEVADPAELATVIALVGTDADGYITADAIVVNTSEADATLWCEATKRSNLSTYRFIPVLPDGSGVACE